MASKKTYGDKNKGKNLKAALKHIGLNGVKAAQITGLSNSGLGALIRGENEIKEYHYKLFEVLLGINRSFIDNEELPIVIQQGEEHSSRHDKAQIENRQLVENLLQTKEKLIESLEDQIKNLKIDKEHLKSKLDQALAAIEDLKRELRAMGKGKETA